METRSRPAHTLVAVLAISACAGTIGVIVESHVASLAVLGAAVYAYTWHVAVVEGVRRGRR